MARSQTASDQLIESLVERGIDEACHCEWPRRNTDRAASGRIAPAMLGARQPCMGSRDRTADADSRP